MTQAGKSIAKIRYDHDLSFPFKVRKVKDNDGKFPVGCELTIIAGVVDGSFPIAPYKHMKYGELVFVREYFPDVTINWRG